MQARTQSDFRTIRVFVSSTFLDMQAERDYLARFVFPKLREKLLNHRIHLIDVDLRWGVTDDQDALIVCRDIIDECRPRFLCILGGRYGWVPPGNERSIAAEEIFYGVLNRIQDNRGFAHFYFRDPVSTESMVELFPGQYREPFGSQTERLLHELKSAIVSAGFDAFLYRGKWDHKASRLTGLQDFGERVFAEIVQSVDLERTEQAASDVDEADVLASTFIEQKLTGFLLGGRKKIQFACLEHLLGADGRGYLCLIGEAGSGKSALLSHIIRSMTGKAQHSVILLYHFVGSAPGSTDANQMLRQFCERLGFSIPEAIEPDMLPAFFYESLVTASEAQGIAIVIDNINHLSQSGAYSTLSWLPRKLPDNVRVLLSTTLPEVLVELKGIADDVRDIALARLDNADRAAIIGQFLQRYGKAMTPAQQSDLLAKSDAGVPLYLRAALEELRTLGTFEEIMQRIKELPSTTLDLFKWIFRRLERDDGFRSASGASIGEALIRSFASFISISRTGLSERELSGLLRAELIDGNTPVPEERSHSGRIQSNEGFAVEDAQGNLSALLLLLRPYMYRRGELLDFHHEQVKRAAIALYAEGEEKLAAHKRLGLHFLRVVRSRQASKESLSAQELLYHLRSANMWDEIVSTLSDRAVFDRIPPGTYGVGYDNGMFTSSDESAVNPEALLNLDPEYRCRIAGSLAEIFALRARYHIETANSFERPLQLTAHRLAQTDADAFGRYRDTFYGFMFIADRAFAYADIASAGSTLRAKKFLLDWRDVAYLARRLSRNGHQITGLSHQLEDLCSLTYLDSLMKLSDLSVQDIGTGDGLANVDEDIDRQHQSSGEKADKNTRSWISGATPILNDINVCFESMRWSDNPSPRAVGRFESEIKELVARLPPLPPSVNLEAISFELDRCFKKTINQGSPIPDAFDYHVILPRPGSMWNGKRRVSACVRMGVFVSKLELEGYGELSTGVLIEPELSYDET